MRKGLSWRLFIVVDFPPAEALFECISSFRLFEVQRKTVPDSDAVFNWGDISEPVCLEFVGFECVVSVVSLFVEGC